MKRSSTFSVRPATSADALHVGRNLRKADKEEAIAAYGPRANAQWLAIASFLASRETSFALLSSGVPFCVTGCKPPGLLSDVAVPWMVGTDEILRNVKASMGFCKDLLKVWRSCFPYMQNYVHAKNTVSVSWLQRVGFEVYYPEPYGPNGEMFHRFCLRSS